MANPIKIFWDDNAKADLKLIFEFIKLKSPQGAINVIADIVKQSKSIHYIKQFQVDEFLGGSL